MKLSLDLNRVKISVKELKYFTAFFMAICFLLSTPYTNRFFRPTLVVILAYGLIILAKFFCQGNALFKKPLFLPLFLFSAICCVNILFHFTDGLSTFVTNGGQFTVACLYFFIFFFQFSMLDSEDRGNILRFSFNIYICGTLFISVISLIMLLFQYSGVYSVNGITSNIGINGRTVTNGLVSYQLFGICLSSSILGGTCSIALLVSIVSLWLNDARYRRFYIISIIIFILTLCAANAFASALIIMVFFSSYVGCHYLTSITALHGTRLAKRILKLIVLMFGALIAIYVLYYAVQGAEASVINLYERTRVSVCTTIEKLEETFAEWKASFSEPPIASPGSSDSPSSPGSSETAPPAIEQKPPMLIERELKNSLNSGRFEIWAAGFQKFLEHPIFGVTNENIGIYISDRFYSNIHSGYLTLLVGTGIVGSSLIVFFGLSLLIKALRFIAVHSGTTAKHLSLLVAVCLAILAGDLVNGNFVFAPSESYIFLWLLLGEIYSITYAQALPMKLTEKRADL